MALARSTASFASNASSQMLEEIASRSQTKSADIGQCRIYKLAGSAFNDDQLRVIWNSLGLYISRNLRMGRGISVPKLGAFTFTAPEVRLKGVTNQSERDLKPRVPVFLLVKDFVKGMQLRSAIFFHQEFGAGLRPYAAAGSNGDVPVTKLNMVEVASYANMTKDAVEMGINRIIKYIQEKLSGGQSLSLELPNVGQLISRNSLMAVKYNENLHRETRTVLSKSVDQRKMYGSMNLTQQNLKKFTSLANMSQHLSGKPEEFFEIDQSARKYLNDTFGLHFDPTNTRRTSANFDRMVATKQFDHTNQSLKASQTKRFSSTLSNFNGSVGTFGSTAGRMASRDFNFALKLVREWVNSHCSSSQNAYRQFLSKLLPNHTTNVLSVDNLFQACRGISIDITEQQAQELFRIMDLNRDGYVTADQWEKVVKFEDRALLRDLAKHVSMMKLTSPRELLEFMGIQGGTKASVHIIKAGLLKLKPSLSDQHAVLICRLLSKGEGEIQLHNLFQALQISESSQSRGNGVDSEWEQKFFGRLDLKLGQQGIVKQQLVSRLRFYDMNNSGFIEQTDFKNVLAEVGIILTLSELAKLVKIIRINSLNSLSYSDFIDRLGYYEGSGANEPTKSLTASEFNRRLRDYKVQTPINVRKLVSELQTNLFKEESQAELMRFVNGVDLNKDGVISSDDLKAYWNSVEESNNTGQKFERTTLNQLVSRISQKATRKKISFYDLFRQIDKGNNGFITKQEWMLHLDSVIQLTHGQKEAVFTHIDRTGLRMIDYKTFLDFMKGAPGEPITEKFDWAEDILSKIKSWTKSCGLTAEDSFRFVDRDGDTYLGEKDMTTFLIDQIKVEPRAINQVRLQKLLKLLDSYKRGKVTITDWMQFVCGVVSKDWVQQAKQQIGMTLSRVFSSLSDAFIKITQGDKKMLYSSFEKWVNDSKALSGFMANEDILKHLYAMLDTHKKGYLIESDFCSAFGSYNWKASQATEFFDTLRLKFQSCQQAFSCMVEYKKGTTLSLPRFKTFISELFGSRFKSSDCDQIWHMMVGKKAELSLQQFRDSYGREWLSRSNPIEEAHPKDEWRYEDFSIIKGTQVRSMEYSYNEAQKLEQQCNKILNNVKDIISSSPKTIEQVFEQVDTQSTGQLTNLQFKKAFRALNIALTSKEIDLLLNFCNFKPDKLIQWKNFVKMLQLRQEKAQIVQRMAPKMQEVSDLMHHYMVSPKDAFRKYDTSRIGHLQFQSFHILIKQLYVKANLPIPEYKLIQELFNHIDGRKDSKLDYQQWIQSFKACKQPNLLMGTIAPEDKVQENGRNSQLQNKAVLGISGQNVISRAGVATAMNNRSPSPTNKDQTGNNNGDITLSAQYEDILHLLSRNRKHLQTIIEEAVIKQQAQSGKQSPSSGASSTVPSMIPFSVLPAVMLPFLKSHSFTLSDKQLHQLLSFAMTGDKIDYRTMVASWKQRGETVGEFPKKKFF